MNPIEEDVAQIKILEVIMYARTILEVDIPGLTVRRISTTMANRSDDSSDNASPAKAIRYTK
jgi:hypothetical protein